jgi:hypothetical protein
MPALQTEAIRAELERSFQRATSARGLMTQNVVVGGRLVALRFAGAELQGPLTRALAHLAAGTGSPALTICVADSASTGVAPRVESRLGSPGSGALHCVCLPDSGAVYYLDATSRVAFFWLPARESLKTWDLAAPFRLLFAWWAQTLGAQLAHGAVVGAGSGSLLFAGPGGAGKSTLTLACLRHGLCTLGDDYVWIEPGSPYRAHSLYCSVKAFAGPLLAELGDPVSTDEKTTVFLAGRPGAQLARSLPLHGVAALRIAARPFPVVRRTTPMQVLAALGPSSLLQLPGSGADGLARLARLVRETRNFALDVGSDHTANAEVVAQLLEQVRGSTPAERLHGAPSGGTA